MLGSMATRLETAIRAAVKESGLGLAEWSRRAGVPLSTLNTAMVSGACNGRTLAALQEAGVVVSPRVIASMGRTA